MSIKYKDDEGNFKEIKIKTKDSLPIGTIVDYDGDTVPDGYEEVEDSSILWKNLNPTEEFESQTVNLSDSNYKYYEVIFLLINNGGSTCSSGKVPKNNLAYLNYVGGTGTLLAFKREVSSKTANTITFGDATRINTNATENTRCVPVSVIGYY